MVLQIWSRESLYVFSNYLGIYTYANSCHHQGTHLDFDIAIRLMPYELLGPLFDDLRLDQRPESRHNVWEKNSTNKKPQALRKTDICLWQSVFHSLTSLFQGQQWNGSSSAVSLPPVSKAGRVWKALQMRSWEVTTLRVEPLDNCFSSILQ